MSTNHHAVVVTQGAALNLHAIRDRTWRLVPCSAVTTVGTSPPLCTSPFVSFLTVLHLTVYVVRCHPTLCFVRGARGHPVHRASCQSRPGSEKHQRQRHWCCRGGNGDGGRACRAMTVAGLLISPGVCYMSCGSTLLSVRRDMTSMIEGGRLSYILRCFIHDVKEEVGTSVAGSRVPKQRIDGKESVGTDAWWSVEWCRVVSGQKTW